MNREEKIIQEQSELIGRLIDQMAAMLQERSHEHALGSMQPLMMMQAIMAANCGGYFPAKGYQA